MEDIRKENAVKVRDLRTFRYEGLGRIGLMILRRAKRQNWLLFVVLRSCTLLSLLASFLLLIFIAFIVFA